MKKLGSILIALALLLSVCPMAMAANDFTPAGADWDNGIVWDGGTVTLDRDISIENRIFVNGDTVLDLNGYTITITNPEPILIWENATLTVTGGGGGGICRETAGIDCLIVVAAGSKLILEDGTYSNTGDAVIVVQEGAEAEIGTGGGCKIVASDESGKCIFNFGTITAIKNTEMVGNKAGVINLGTITTIDGCNISTSENNVENYGEIDSITNTHLISSRTEGGAALNNQGYIGTLGEGVKIDCAFEGIGNDSTHSTIDTISMEYIRGGAEAISNRGTIHTIAAGEFDAEWHGMENFFGTIGVISGGNFNAGIINHYKSTIKEISGGTFFGRQSGLSNGGTVEKISGGTFVGRWEDMDESLKMYVFGIDNEGRIGTMSGYTVDGDTGYGIRNKLTGEIGELGEGVLIGELGKVNNEATIHKIFDESILAGNNATGETVEKPLETGEKAAPKFTDMANHWAAGDVLALAAEGVIDGLPDGTFGPANDVTRGELAKLVLAVSGREEKSGQAAFADTEGTWSMKYVNGLTGVGIIREDDYPDGFQQGEEATRVEVITMLMRSMGYDMPIGEVKLSFTDADSLTDEQAYYVDCAVRRGIIKGMPDGTLKPDENVSRAEVAAMLRRVEAARPGK